MGQLIDDDVLHTIAACGTLPTSRAHIRDRVDGVSDRICIYQPGPIAVESLAEVVDDTQSLTSYRGPTRRFSMTASQTEYLRRADHRCRHLGYRRRIPHPREAIRT